MIFPLILGSASPRRKEILSFFDLPFRQCSSDFDEDSVPFTGDPQGYVQGIALGKAQALAAQYPQSSILTADTTVYQDGHTLGKPKDWQQAEQMVTQLAGKWHEVHTGVVLYDQGRFLHRSAISRVHFRPLSASQVKQYIHAVHSLDKAGGYAIQGVGGLIVDKIDGCYYNVMGLPLKAIEELFAEAGTSLWSLLGSPSTASAQG